jgi:competence protein ComEC
MKFSIDEIAPIDPFGNTFNVTLIPDIRTNYFAPLHLRSVNVKRELLEEPFYDAIMRKNWGIGEISNWPKPKKFSSSVVQGAYYIIDKHKLPDNIFHPDTIIDLENDFFVDGLQKESPYQDPKDDGSSMNIEHGLSMLSTNEKGRDDALYLYGLYVGQGDSLLMVCPNGSVYLIDTNHYWINNPSIFNEINRILDEHHLPQNQIKAMIITHKHLDHIRGAWALLNQFDVEYFLINYDYAHPTRPVQLLLQTANKYVPNLVNVNKPGIIQEGSVTIHIQNPDINTRDVTVAPDINDSSIALDVEFMGRHVFLTGDAGFPVISSKFNKNRKSGNVLKVSHHGSTTGTDQDVLDKLNPEYCFISAGNHKRFRHPHIEVLELIDKKARLSISKEYRRTICYKINSSGTVSVPCSMKYQYVVLKNNHQL